MHCHSRAASFPTWVSLLTVADGSVRFLFTPTGLAGAVAWDGVLVRFGELGIKSEPVRRQMIKTLRENLFDSLVRLGVEGDVVQRGSRLWMAGPDADALCDVACRTFGVVSASPARLVASDLGEVGTVAAELALEQEWNSFGIRARRDGSHSFSSTDMGIQVGTAVYVAAEAAGRSPRVDLDDPDLEVFVEARGQTTYVSVEKRPGPGGLPLGAQGKAVVLVSDRASLVAAWLVMRRGASVVPVHAGDQGSAPLELLEPMQAWGLPEDVEVLPVCSGAVSKEVLLMTAATIAHELGADAVVTGDTLDSDLSQRPDVPVLRPVCGLDPVDVERIATLVGLPNEKTVSILATDASETVESLLSMRRTVAC